MRAPRGDRVNGPSVIPLLPRGCFGPAAARVLGLGGPSTRSPRPARSLMDSAPMIRLQGLTVRYGRFTAVDGLDLDVRPGELFGLLGPNGAGKSSTLRVLIGQRPPSAGRVTIAGLEVTTQWQQIK